MYNQYTSSSLPQSGVFFVIQLCALYTAKRKGSGLYCYCNCFFYWCPHWIGLELLIFWHLLLCTFVDILCRSTGQYEVISSQQVKIRPRTDEQEMTFCLFFSQPHKVFIYRILLVVIVNPRFELFNLLSYVTKSIFRNDLILFF